MAEYIAKTTTSRRDIEVRFTTDLHPFHDLRKFDDVARGAVETAAAGEDWVEARVFHPGWGLSFACVGRR